MKKSLIILITLYFSASASAKTIDLICTVDDNSYYDNVKIYESENQYRAVIFFLNEKDLGSGEVIVSSTSYSIRGDYNIYINGQYEKLGVYEYLINRTTGAFKSIIAYDGSEPMISNGNCRRNQPKF